MIRKLLSTVAAIGIAAGIAHAANVPYTTGPIDPGNALGNINTLTTNINVNAPGIVGVQTSLQGNVAATTNEITLMSQVVPGGVLTVAGQSLRIRCTGALSGTSNSRRIALGLVGANNSAYGNFFPPGNVGGTPVGPGTMAFNTGAVTQAGAMWDLELLVTYNASSSSLIYKGSGLIGSTVVSPLVSSDTLDNLAANLTARCDLIDGTAQSGDASAYQLLIEQVK